MIILLEIKYRIRMLTWNVIIIATTYPVKIVSPVSCLWGQINRGCTVGKHLLAMLLSPKLHRAQLFCLVFHTPPVIIIPIFYSDQGLPDQVLLEVQKVWWHRHLVNLPDIKQLSIRDSHTSYLSRRTRKLLFWAPFISQKWILFYTIKCAILQRFTLGV